MTTPREYLCCKENPRVDEKLQELDVVPGGVACIIEHEGFYPVYLNQWVLPIDTGV